MAVFRTQKDKDNPYVMLHKSFLQNPDLSAKAKGILAYLLSLPDDWQTYENELIKHFKDGRDSIRAGIKELIENGYIERVRIRDEKGMLREYEYSVYEHPTQSGKSNVGESNIGKTNIGKPKVGKSTTNNKNKTNKKQTNKNLIKKDQNVSASSTKTKGNFNKFDQRKYDGSDGGLTIGEIENKLLGWEG